jgi:RNA polymerase sigma factor (sigma-70 family)
MTMAMAADSELVERSRRRDVAAFGELVERHQRLVIGVALARCGDPALAEEVAQEAFVTAWRDLDRLREDARVGTWVAGIARNLAAGATRRRVRRDAATLPEPAPVPTPAELAIDREDRDLLARALAALPDAQREVLVLYYLDGQSIARIAADLGTTDDVVKQRLSRGRRALRDGVADRVESALTRVRDRPSLRAGIVAALPSTTVSNVAATSAAGKAFAMMTISKWVIATAAVAATGGAIWLGTTARRGDAAASASPPTPAPAATTAAAGALHVRRIDPAARAKLFAQIRAAEHRAGVAAAPPDPGIASHGAAATPHPALPDDPDPDKTYVRSAVGALAPQLLDCYDAALATQPGLAGKLVVDFTIAGEPGVGGVVGDSTIDGSASTITDPAMQACVTQTMYALEIDPPANGGTVNVTYPFTFAPKPD